MDINSILSFVATDKIIKDSERRGGVFSKNEKNVARLLGVMPGGNPMLGVFHAVEKARKKTPDISPEKQKEYDAINEKAEKSVSDCKSKYEDLTKSLKGFNVKKIKGLNRLSKKQAQEVMRLISFVQNLN